MSTNRNAKGLISGLVGCLLLCLTACNGPRTFDRPDAALDSLINAVRANNDGQWRDVLGSHWKNVLSSGDSVADDINRKWFLAAYDQKHQLLTEPNGDTTLTVGTDDWPLPIPLVREWWGWSWDVAAGREEIISRRVGRNELDTIQTCLAIVDAQRDYAAADPQGVGTPVYAEKFFSDPGKKNGLYWPTAGNEEPSPLGLLVAEAQEEGYVPAGKPQPFHGYHFKMLKAQGPDAPGGKLDYVADGKMLLGFGVVAYPVEYGKSGVMTFLVGGDGVVYEKDLGDETKQIALQMTAFDPGSGWERVKEPAETPPESLP